MFRETSYPLSLKLEFHFLVKHHLSSDFGVFSLLHGGSLLPSGVFYLFMDIPFLISKPLNHPSLLGSCHILPSTSIMFPLVSSNNYQVLTVANLNPSSPTNGPKLQNSQHGKRPPPKVSKFLRYYVWVPIIAILFIIFMFVYLVQMCVFLFCSAYFKCAFKVFDERF